MDFKSLISKISSLDTPIESKPAAEAQEVLRLDEDTEFRVLAGLTPLTESLIAEKKLTKAEKDKKEEVVKSMKKDKDGFEKRYGKRGEEVMHATATKVAKKKEESVEGDDEALNEYQSKDGKYVHKGKYGSDYDGSDHQDEPKKKEKSGMTGAERREQKSKDKEQDKASKDYEKKHGKGSVTRHKMEGAELDKENFQKKFDSMVEAKKEKMAKKDKKMDEGSKPDFLDLDKDGNKKEPMKKAAADKGGDKKDSGKKGMSAAQAKYFGKKNESVSTSKKVVAESVEASSNFRELMKLVIESGGQQAIDPLDKALFDWATRVAQRKFTESTKAEVYAGLVYERMGGRFEMYDVLSEEQK
jgi:hypothetical protein